MTYSTKTKKKKQANSTFREILVLTKKKPKYPRFGNWEAWDGKNDHFVHDLYRGIEFWLGASIQAENNLDCKNNPTHQQKFKEILEQVYKESLATGCVGGKNWAIIFTGRL